MSSTKSLIFILLVCFFSKIQSERPPSRVEMEWSHINFTWESREQYLDAVKTGKYIPENVVPAGMKFSGDYCFISTVKWRPGTPVTLSYIDRKSKVNNLLVPYPNWKMNDDRSCCNLQSVLSFEIDTHNVMWVLDGDRMANNKCPPKLVLLDINNKGAVISSYTFPNEVSPQEGAGLTNIVLDETRHDVYAYIADCAFADPGVIAYSKNQNRAWKLRDRTMFAELGTPPYKVKNLTVDDPLPITGLALSPPPANKCGDRTVYFSSLTGYNLYSISTKILKNEELYKTGEWRREIKFVGKKQGSSHGLMMDNRGILYYSLLEVYGVGIWNSSTPFSSSKVLCTNSSTVIWPEIFGFDQKGTIYLLANNAYLYFNPKFKIERSPDIKFRIISLYTGAKSYLYPLLN